MSDFVPPFLTNYARIIEMVTKFVYKWLQDKFSWVLQEEPVRNYNSRPRLL